MLLCACVHVCVVNKIIGTSPDFAMHYFSDQDNWHLLVSNINIYCHYIVGESCKCLMLQPRSLSLSLSLRTYTFTKAGACLSYIVWCCGLKWQIWISKVAYCNILEVNHKCGPVSRAWGDQDERSNMAASSLICWEVCNVAQLYLHHRVLHHTQITVFHNH